jgi:hypothetical protein
VTFANLARASGRAYVMRKDMTMAHTASLEPNKTANRLVLAVAAVLGVAVAGAAVLWVHYGTAVFFEMIVAGIAMCF